jgi:fatty acyl-CoA reductase
VYNYVSSVQKPITWDEYMDKASRHGVHVPTIRTVWCYSLTLNKYRFLHILYALLLHFLPAIIIDGFATLLGKEPRYVA